MKAMCHRCYRHRLIAHMNVQNVWGPPLYVCNSKPACTNARRALKRGGLQLREKNK